MNVSRTIYCKRFETCSTLLIYLCANIWSLPRKCTMKTKYIDSFKAYEVQITNNSYEELKLTVLTSIAIVSAIVQITNNSYEELKLGIHRDANAPGSLGSNNQ